MFTLSEQGVPAKPLEDTQAYMSASYWCTVSRYCSVAAELATTWWRWYVCTEACYASNLQAFWQKGKRLFGIWISCKTDSKGPCGNVRLVQVKHQKSMLWTRAGGAVGEWRRRFDICKRSTISVLRNASSRWRDWRGSNRPWPMEPK